MAWSKDQIDEVCRIYGLNRFTICPDCQVKVTVERGPDDELGHHSVTFTCQNCGATATRQYTTFDPKDFIRPPFTQCPDCHQDRFGVLMVAARSYTRRCRECRHTETLSLPPLEKKLIYLDQLAISNLMFALNPDTKQFREGKVDPFWRSAFEKLDRLVKLQLIVCPETEFHEQESAVHVRFEALRQIYQHLSDGVRFRDAATVERFQIHLHALNWLEGRAEEAPRVAKKDALHGNPNEWHDVIRVVVRSRMTEENIEEVRAYRDTVGERIESSFVRWQAMLDFRFADWLAFEVGETGRLIRQAWMKAVERWGEVQSGVRELTLEDVLTPPEVVLVNGIHREFQARGMNSDQAWAKLNEYLASPSMIHVPSVRISSMLWTAIVRQAASGGRKRAPSRGVVNDIKLLSTVIPYCDGLFIDREMHNLLLEEPLLSELPYGARLFSSRNPEQFLAFLDGIETAASPAHLQLAGLVYGDERLKPYTSMFGDDA